MAPADAETAGLVPFLQFDKTEADPERRPVSVHVRQVNGVQGRLLQPLPNVKEKTPKRDGGPNVYETYPVVVQLGAVVF